MKDANKVEGMGSHIVQALRSTMPFVDAGKVTTGELKSKISEAFYSTIPFGANGIAALKIELIEGVTQSLAFLEDNLALGRSREVVAVNGNKDRVYVSRDLGVSWMRKYDSVKFDSHVRAVFSLRNGERLVRTFSGRMYHFDSQDCLIGSQDTGAWPWHGQQGIGESSTGTVMYGEYAPLRTEDGVQELSVWRYRSNRPEAGWKRVFTLPAAARPPEGQLRHFHVCRPNSGNLEQWILASGDIGAHCRLWFSNNDGDDWSEVDLTQSATSNLPKEPFPEVLRFTQFSVLNNGDLIWGTDDTQRARRAALVRLSAIAESPAFDFCGWLGANCVRNISSLGEDEFLIMSESKGDVSSADLIFYQAASNRIVRLLLPNISQSKSSVTTSLGSDVLADGVGFYPAIGSIVMSPKQRGIFRLSIKEIAL